MVKEDGGIVAEKIRKCIFNYVLVIKVSCSIRNVKRTVAQRRDWKMNVNWGYLGLKNQVMILP
jgi:hypothetical protein